MSRLLTRAYLVAAILALVLIAAFFFWRVSSVVAIEERRAAARFDVLSQEITNLWQNKSLEVAGSEVSPRFSEDATHGGPLVVSVYSLDAGVDYLWAQSGQFLDYAPEAVGTTPQIRTNDLVHRQFSRSFELPDGTRRIVTAVYTVLNERNAYPVLRDTLLAFLGMIAAILVITLIHSFHGAVQAQRKHRRSDESSVDDPHIDEPPSLGLMPKEGLDHRLTLELERAGFHEQDIAVAWFDFHSVTDHALANHNAQTILSFFAFADLCFDGGQDKNSRQMVVVLPNTSLLEGLAQVERFQHFYWNERITWGREHADFACGLSARNGRLVDAERIIRECRAAVRRADALPGRIVGFQPDPQRYREYIAGHSS